MTTDALMRPLPPKPLPPTALSRWLRRTGYTVSELARAAEVTKGTISRIASGQYPGMSEHLERKLKALTGLKSLE